MPDRRERSPKKPDNWKLPKRYGDPEYPKHPDTGKLICASYARTFNKFGDPVCLRSPIDGMARCRLHGGATPSGIESVHYEGKGTSKALKAVRTLPKRYDVDFIESKLNQITGMANEIALFDARLMELLGTLDSGETGALWEELRDAAEMTETALKAGDADEAAFQATRMLKLIQRGGAEWQRWGEIYDLVDRKRKLLLAASKIRKEERQSITPEQQMMFVHELAEVIRESVLDEATLIRITNGFARIIERRRSRSVQPVIRGDAKSADAD